MNQPLPRAVLRLAVPLLVALGAVTGCRSPKDAPPEMQRLSMEVPQTDGPVVIHMRSDGFEPGKEIPDEYSAYHDNISPPMGWSNVPDTARSLVLIVEDPDAAKPKPFVHWIVYGIPPEVSTLPQGRPTTPRLDQPAGAVQGLNSTGVTGYFGPKPPKGDPAHHYHFQLFALDRPLALQPGATRQDLLKAMDGHVVGKGDLVGTYHE